MCKRLEPPLHSLYFASKQPDFLVIFQSDPGFLKVFQSFSLHFYWPFHSFSVQSLYLNIPIDTDLWIIQALKKGNQLKRWASVGSAQDFCTNKLILEELFKKDLA